MGRAAPSAPNARSGGSGWRSNALALSRPTGRAPNWLVLAVAALALVGLVEEYVSGPGFTGVAAAIAFIGIHASWPLVLRWPRWGAVLAVFSAFGAAITLDRVGWPR